MSALATLQSVSKRFDTHDRPEVLHDVDLVVAATDSIAIIGPSGSGKSTLLNVLGGLLPPTSGAVSFDGTDLASLNEDGLADLRHREIGFIFQAHHLLPQCSALENVLVPTLVDIDRKQRATTTERAARLLEQVGLKDRFDHRPARLSGGECQRVAVARALINRPRLLLADEPTGSLDEVNADHLADLLGDLHAHGDVAIVTVTHSRRLARRMTRVLELTGSSLQSMTTTPTS